MREKKISLTVKFQKALCNFGICIISLFVNENNCLYILVITFNINIYIDFKHEIGIILFMSSTASEIHQSVFVFFWKQKTGCSWK